MALGYPAENPVVKSFDGSLRYWKDENGVPDVPKKPGETTIETVEEVPPVEGGALSLHQLPTSSLLNELRDCCRLDILLVTVQPEYIPEAVSPGLSHTVEALVPQVCQRVIESCL